MIGAYFSKPDWHSEYYWWPKYATADRNNNYDIRKYPWRWNKFKEFTYNQLSELMHDYGSIDILWLDGGWVRPRETVNEEVLSWGARIPEWSQDIDMPKIAMMARKAQPGLLIVDRTVHGRFENYQTPEQRIPSTQLDHPWESCMTLANNWGYVPNDKYKTSAKVIHTLIEVVAKGGSLLLGVGPKPGWNIY
jgi:alpha-L-fucosidase